MATVNTSGIVTAVAPGSATITATTADGGKTATCAVTVQAEQYAVTIAPLTNGSIAANPTTAIAGSPITLDVTPDDGYRLKAGTLKYNDIVITGNTFTMLAGDVTITAEFEPIPGADTGIDYSVDDLIVPSEENFDEIYINLTQETLILPSAYTVAAYSIDGGAKWKLVKDALSAAKFPKLFTKDLTLCLSDKALDTAKGPNKGKPLPGAQIVTFPKINKRQKAPALAVNYLVGADATGATLGDWLFVSKVKGADTTVAVKDGVQIGIADAANKNKTVDSKGFGQFYPGLTNGIPVQPIGKDAKGKDKVQKAVYFIKAAAKPADASGAYTAASKPKKVTASGQQKRPAFKVDPKKKLIKVKAGTIAQSADGTVTTYTAKGEITAPGTYDLWMAATAKKPASAKQPLTIS